MAQIRDTDALTRRTSAALTLVLFGAVLGSAYVSGRRYRRWLKENHLFAAPRARVDRFKTDYSTKKANTTEMASLFGGMVVEIATASLEEFRK